MRSAIWLMVLASVVVAAVLIAFWVSSTLPPSESAPIPPDFPAVDVEQVNPHYLSFTPYSWRDWNESKIYLVSATPRYGYYRNQTGDVQKGDSCFIVNITVRNDYSENQLPPSHEKEQQAYDFTQYGYYIFFDAFLYDKNGTVEVERVAVDEQLDSFGNPVTVNYIRVDSGETRTFDIYIATENRDIERFELSIFDVGPPVVA